MPRTTVYIRNEDWEKWRATENKSQLISYLLHRSEAKHTSAPVKLRTSSKDPLYAFCEHGQIKATCLVKGCKYGI